MTTKETVIGMIHEMPGSISISEIVYRLHVIDEIRKGESDIKNGRTITHESMKSKIQR